MAPLEQRAVSRTPINVNVDRNKVGNGLPQPPHSYQYSGPMSIQLVSVASNVPQQTDIGNYVGLSFSHMKHIYIYIYIYIHITHI